MYKQLKLIFIIFLALSNPIATATEYFCMHQGGLDYDSFGSYRSAQVDQALNYITSVSVHRTTSNGIVSTSLGSAGPQASVDVRMWSGPSFSGVLSQVADLGVVKVYQGGGNGASLTFFEASSLKLGLIYMFDPSSPQLSTVGRGARPSYSEIFACKTMRDANRDHNTEELRNAITQYITQNGFIDRSFVENIDTAQTDTDSMLVNTQAYANLVGLWSNLDNNQKHQLYESAITGIIAGTAIAYVATRPAIVAAARSLLPRGLGALLGGLGRVLGVPGALIGMTVAANATETLEGQMAFNQVNSVLTNLTPENYEGFLEGIHWMADDVNAFYMLLSHQATGQ